MGEHSSGDFALCFATGNRGLETDEGELRAADAERRAGSTRSTRPTIDAVEESILNALLAAETMTGRDGNTVHALPHDLLLEALGQAG